MSVAVAACPPTILQFFDNAGNPNAGGSVLTQVGGVNAPTYQDAAGTTALPNPIPLNSRGEVSNAAGASCQLFLPPGTVYTFTQFDKNGNQLNQASSVSSINLAGEVLAPLLSVVTDEPILASLVQTAAEISAGVTPVNYAYAPFNVKRYGATGDGATDDTAAIQIALNLAGTAGLASVFFPYGNYKVTSTLTIQGNRITLYGEGAWASQITCAITGNAAPSLFSFTANSGGTSGQFLQVEGLQFNGNSLTGSSGNGNCFSLIGDLRVTFVSFCTFQDCSFLGFNGTGQDQSGSSIPAASIYCYFGNVLKVENCLFETFQTGIVIDGVAGADHTAKVCVSASTFETGAVFGVEAKFVDQLLIDNQTVFNNCASGVSLGECGETCTIDDCRFKLMTTGGAIIAVSASLVDQLNITNCYFYTAFQASPEPVVDVGTNCRGCLISGCEFLFDATVVNGLGIVIQNPSGLIGGAFTILTNRWVLSNAATLASCVLANNGTNAINSLLIAGNYFGQPAPTSGAQVITTAVALTGAGGLTSPTVANNAFCMGTPGSITTGIDIGSGVTGALLLNNTYPGGAVTTPVSDSGSKTIRIEAGGLLTSADLGNLSQTGAKTATFSANNKPGTNNATAPAAWLAVPIGGVTGYIPWYSA